MARAKRSPEARRASGPSGPTQTAESRKAAGRTRIEVWLPNALVAQLDAMRGEMPRREAIESGITLLLSRARRDRSDSHG